MNLKKILLASAFAAVLGAGLPDPAWAAAKTLGQAVQQVKRSTGGKVLSANTVVRGNKEVHRIKVLTQDGRVRVVQVEGRTIRKQASAKKPNRR